jgi:hypothetical protein
MIAHTVAHAILIVHDRTSLSGVDGVHGLSSLLIVVVKVVLSRVKPFGNRGGQEDTVCDAVLVSWD